MKLATRKAVLDFAKSYFDAKRRMMRDKEVSKEERTNFIEGTLHLDNWLRAEKLLDRNGNPVVK